MDGINPGHPMTQMAQDPEFWPKMFMILTHKYKGVDITQEDIALFLDSYSEPTITVQGKVDGISFRIMERAAGVAIAKKAGGMPQ